MFMQIFNSIAGEMSFNDEPELNYNYNRLLFILSITL